MMQASSTPTGCNWLKKRLFQTIYQILLKIDFVFKGVKGLEGEGQDARGLGEGLGVHAH